jgi:8-oxo-dGTP pyrophosphatase MutT (NUDIX family)
VQSWKENKVKTLVSTRVFQLEERRAVNPRNQRELPFYVMDSPAWVNVVPLTPEGRVVMVRQYRQGIRAITLEIPGGVVEAGESPEEGARRELLEETGIVCDRLELLGAVDTNPAIQTNQTYTFLAADVQRTAALQQDSAEDIEVVEVELSKVQEMIRQGRVTHALVVAAFYWLEQRRDLVNGTGRLLDELAEGQLERVARLARRVNRQLTAEDLMNPQDFPELAQDPDFNYHDGMLAGIEAARMAFRRFERDLSALREPPAPPAVAPPKNRT